MRKILLSCASSSDVYFPVVFKGVAFKEINGT